MPGARPSSFVLTQSGALRLYSTQELLNMQPPEWLVDNIIPTATDGSFTVVYGPSGVGKSFFVQDIALSVATGCDWQRRATQPGLVAYVSAEGRAGMGKRVNAWRVSKGLDVEDINVAWLLEPLSVYYDSEHVDMLLERFDELHDVPRLVVLDTLARCFEGDENETEDMSNFVKGVDRIRMETGAAVIAIHHTNSSESRERGNGALRAATDTMIKLSPGIPGQSLSPAASQGLFTVSCAKQKEAAPFPLGVGQLMDVPSADSVTCRVDWLRSGEEL